MEPVHILGYSMGGLIIRDFALQHPQRVQSMIFSAPAGFDLKQTEIPGADVYAKLLMAGGTARSNAEP